MPKFGLFIDFMDFDKEYKIHKLGLSSKVRDKANDIDSTMDKMFGKIDIANFQESVEKVANSVFSSPKIKVGQDLSKCHDRKSIDIRPIDWKSSLFLRIHIANKSYIQQWEKSRVTFLDQENMSPEELSKKLTRFESTDNGYMVYALIYDGTTSIALDFMTKAYGIIVEKIKTSSIDYISFKLSRGLSKCVALDASVDRLFLILSTYKEVIENLSHTSIGPDREINESNLGLNNKVKKKFDKVDAVDNISTIQFEDPEVEHICHKHGVYTVDDAARVTSIKGWFFFNEKIKSFVEFKYFTGLKDIEKYMFSDCSYLQSINIPDNVTIIGDSAFYGCSSLHSINIPDNVTIIESYAFKNCENLQSVTIPNSVTSIGNNAFYDCSSLQTINIPDSVTSIGDCAFRYCNSLQSITIPDSVTSIGDSAFIFCETLRMIIISRNCPVYSQLEKEYPSIQLIEPKMNETSNLGLNSKVKKKFNDVDAVDNITQIQFEDPEVERICYDYGVCTVDVAIKVTSIKGWFTKNNIIKSFNEFKYFTGLKEIEDHAFYWCKSLQSINIPDSVTSIRERAFTWCRSLQAITIPNGVTSIGDLAFCWCRSLQTINIPDSVTNIGNETFYGCESLQSIYISKNCLIYDQIKKEYPSIQLIEPKVNESSNLGLGKKIQKKFKDKDTKDAFDILWDVSSFEGTINAMKFFLSRYGYKEVEDIYMPDSPLVYDIIDSNNGDNLYSDLTRRVVVFEISLGRTKPQARDHMLKMWSVTFGEVKSQMIMNIAFSSKKHPEEVIGQKDTVRGWKVTIERITDLIEFCSKYDDNLEEKFDNSDYNGYSTRIDEAELGLNKKIQKKYEKKSPIESLEDYREIVKNFVKAYAKATYSDLIESMDFVVKFIGKRGQIVSTQGSSPSVWVSTPFYSNQRQKKEKQLNFFLGDYGSALKYEDQDNSMKSSVLMNKYVAHFPSSQTKSLSLIDHILDEFSEFLYQEAINYYPQIIEVLGDVQDIVKDYNYEETKKLIVSINESNLGLNGKVKKKFSDVDAIDNVAYIKFEDPEVERICHEHGVYTIDDAARVTSIRGWFFDNWNIKTFDELRWFTGLKEIKNRDFSWCRTLQSVTIPSSVISIGGYAFNRCESLHSINIPDGVTNIGEYAFARCKTLQSIIIPSRVTSIGNSAFSGNSSLQSIVIPDSVTYIGNIAFYDCNNLHTIYISKNCPVYDQVNEQIKEDYPSIQLIEPKVNEASNLGLNKKVQKKFDNTSSVEKIQEDKKEIADHEGEFIKMFIEEALERGILPPKEEYLKGNPHGTDDGHLDDFLSLDMYAPRDKENNTDWDVHDLITIIGNIESFYPRREYDGIGIACIVGKGYINTSTNFFTVRVLFNSAHTRIREIWFGKISNSKFAGSREYGPLHPLDLKKLTKIADVDTYGKLLLTRTNAILLVELFRSYFRHKDDLIKVKYKYRNYYDKIEYQIEEIPLRVRLYRLNTTRSNNAFCDLIMRHCWKKDFK